MHDITDAAEPQIEAWVFDLDNTLYPASCNLFTQIDTRMREFIADLLGLEQDEAYKLQKRFFKEYGTTLRGLMDIHGLPPEEFLDYVHEIDLSPVDANPALNSALEALPGRKIIFTNADTGHADRVMERLGIGHHFEEVFDIVAADYVPKPNPGVYQILLDRYGLDPKKSVMVEDIARNLQPAADLGMTTVWIKSDSPFGNWGADGDYIHHVVDDLVDWLEAWAKGTIN
jgi:putative hydrolase of the HAD superfamily